jgi:hypothetical protein
MNVVVGLYFVLFIAFIFVWTVLLVVTVNLYNKVHTKMEEKTNE